MSIIKRSHKVTDDAPEQETTDEVAFTAVECELDVWDVQKLAADGEIEFEGVGVVTSSNSTDTATVKVRFGKTSDALGSRVGVIANPAWDAANADIVRVKGKVALQSVGASGEFHSHGESFATGETLTETTLNDQAIDTTGGPLTIGPTVDWSVAHADNIITWKWFNVRVIAADELS